MAALTIGARRILGGAEIELDAQTTAEMIRKGRCRLADEADLGRLRDAIAIRPLLNR